MDFLQNIGCAIGGKHFISKLRMLKTLYLHLHEGDKLECHHGVILIGAKENCFGNQL